MRLIVVYPPGGMSDRLARALAAQLRGVLGQPVLVHNLAGAGGTQLRAAVLPLAGVVRAPVLVVGTPAFDGRDFAALIAQARAQPGQLRWASSGVGTSGHLVLARVRRHTGTQIVHVPYEGGGRQLGDALSGQFEVLSTNLAAPQTSKPPSSRKPRTMPHSSGMTRCSCSVEHRGALRPAARRFLHNGAPCLPFVRCPNAACCC